MRRWRISGAVVAAVAINLLLLVGYVWSRDGQTTTIRVDANEGWTPDAAARLAGFRLAAAACSG